MTRQDFFVSLYSSIGCEIDLLSEIERGYEKQIEAVFIKYEHITQMPNGSEKIKYFERLSLEAEKMVDDYADDVSLPKFVNPYEDSEQVILQDNFRRSLRTLSFWINEEYNKVNVLVDFFGEETQINHTNQCHPFVFSANVMDKIYCLCNGEQWNTITKESMKQAFAFPKTYGMAFIVKRNEKGRFLELLRQLEKLLSSSEIRKEWESQWKIVLKMNSGLNKKSLNIIDSERNRNFQASLKQIFTL